jgi:UDP-N-acetylglucosamine diphosphorylase/glucosamine-1-phosphate N-acetyltransferase
VIPVLLFDDGGADLGPLSDLRASYEQRTGAHTAVERWMRSGRLAGVLAPGATADLRRARLATAGMRVNPELPDALLVNGRADVQPEAIAGLEPGETLVAADGTIVAARRAGAVLAAWSAAGGVPANDPSGTRHGTTARVWSRPWHLLDQEALTARMEADMAAIAAAWEPAERGTVPSWATIAGRGHVHVHASAVVGANVVLDSSAGGVLLDAGCEVRHGAIVIGPAYVGPGTIVAERAHLKARTSLGPQCRVGGEVGSALFQGYANKVHDGHLGDALVGEWVNLGAGTVNSNLLNTYGEVAMRLRPDGPLERTGRQFMGCVVGDHVKLAIGTRIMTGVSIGTGTMWAASAPVTGAVGAFQWVTDDGRRAFQAEKFVRLAHTVMGRRHVALAPAEEAALRALHACATTGTGA